ncbi:MAG: sugar ABC transporter permease [Spirochaetaceae bacterium]|nr:MAG: sugar ABC transporter permease [Spirochaetaceae bacterium]
MVEKNLNYLRANWVLYALVLPAVVLLIVFNYVPMFGVIIAFKDYRPLLGFGGSQWVGLRWFERMATDPGFLRVIRNTVSIAIGKIVIGQLASLTFALLLNEVRHRLFKRTVQTLVYFPHFLSWVITAGLLIELLSLRGLVNNVLFALVGRRIFFLGDNQVFQATMILTDVWKGYGWGAILYIAAIQAIDPVLYESSLIDGAGRWKQLLHVTLPGIASTIVLLASLSLGNVLNAGFEQILMLYNPAVYQTGDILDTLLYRVGLFDRNFSLSTAISLVKSFVGFFLISLSWWLAKKYAHYHIV